ncbi:SRPBCC family protein [Natronoglomus mannanivorans]|uniref:SRPBCC family protein n=1 Tax=Natronoglomus mannanivorans TaxID=2979990 RepID=UPI003CCCA976
MPIQCEHSIVIERPVETVYTFVSDVSNAPRWMPWADETSVISGSKPSSVAEGQRRRIKQTDFGVQSETIIEAIEVEPGRHYTFESVEGPGTFRGTYRFEPTRNGTRLTRSYRVVLPGLARVMEPIMARRMKRRWRTDLKRIKKTLENDTE